jgi:hypothetical protein
MPATAPEIPPINAPRSAPAHPTNKRPIEKPIIEKPTEPITVHRKVKSFGLFLLSLL